MARGAFLGRNLDKSLKNFSPCFSESPQQTYFTPPPLPPPPSKSGLKLVCNVSIVQNLKSKNSQDYIQTPQWNYTFMNSASVLLQKFSVPSRQVCRTAGVWKHNPRNSGTICMKHCPAAGRSNLRHLAAVGRVNIQNNIEQLPGSTTTIHWEAIWKNKQNNIHWAQWATI